MTKKINNFVFCNVALIIFVAACLLSEKGMWNAKIVVMLLTIYYFSKVGKKFVKATMLVQKRLSRTKMNDVLMDYKA